MSQGPRSALVPPPYRTLIIRSPPRMNNGAKDPMLRQKGGEGLRQRPLQRQGVETSHPPEAESPSVSFSSHASDNN